MSNVDATALRLTDTVFLEPDTNANNASLKQAADQDECTVYVYTPKQYQTQVSAVLDRYGTNYKINYYKVGNWHRKVACFYKTNELTTSQDKYLMHIVSQGGTVKPLTVYLEKRYHCVEVDLLDNDYLMDPLVLNTLNHYQAAWMRRLLDVLFAGGLLLLTLPLWVLIAAAIKLESSGAVFFRQQRTGLFNKEFNIIKFRSMYVDAERHGAQWASKNDSRITRVGRFLRMTRMDELPQLINVLLGDMSLIGPRPEREVFIEQLENHIPFYRLRHMIKPGLTGWAQVSYSYGASVEDAIEKHRRDLFYIKYQSVRLDMKILLRTVLVVLRGQGL